tara:strand:- start:201 stop:395 length:195 start_codon:yes stop_codon:yes gene_type:complete
MEILKEQYKYYNFLKITKKEFKAYVEVQKSGLTNMFDVKKVEELSGLSKEKIIKIMTEYRHLNK